MKRKILLWLCAFAMVGALHAQSIGKGKFAAFKGKVRGNYNFWMYTPADYEAEAHRMPLLVFLHGASLCGKNLDRVRRYGVLDAIERGKVVPALVLAPQNAGGAWKPQKIKELIDWVEANYAVDTTRVYVLGMSLGGYGTMDFVATYPEKVAAAMALCGGCSFSNPDGLGKVPLWIMHGTADRAVSIQQSKRIVEFLQARQTADLLRYDWLENGSHGILVRLFYLQKTYDWLFTHSLADKPGVVDKCFDIGYEDINQTYEELKWFKGMFEDD